MIAAHKAAQGLDNVRPAEAENRPVANAEGGVPWQGFRERQGEGRGSLSLGSKYSLVSRGIPLAQRPPEERPAAGWHAAFRPTACEGQGPCEGGLWPLVWGRDPCGGEKTVPQWGAPFVGVVEEFPIMSNVRMVGNFNRLIFMDETYE